MDAAIADKIVEFIFTATGRHSIICDTHGVIVAAKIPSRIGNVHAGARRMLEENLPDCMVTTAEEQASGGVMKAGCNLPIWHKGELIGSIGIAGDPALSEPVTRMASGLISKELRERELMDLLVGHAARMDGSISAIVSTVAQADASQQRVAAEVDKVEELVSASFLDIQKTDDVISAIQSIAGNTQMLGLNASIEAAHAREHGRGFSIVAESVRKLSVQCFDAAESAKVTQAHLHGSMNQVVVFSKELMADAHEQTRATSALARQVADLKMVSEALMAMTKG